MALKYIKYLPKHSMKNESRNRREIFAALEYGFNVSVFSHDRSREGLLLSDPIDIIFDGVKDISFSIPKWKRILIILLNYFTVIKRTIKLDADFLSCHDITALWIAYIAIRFMKKKPKLIYDSHEFEIGRNTQRNKINIWWITHLERFLIKRCAFSIMVNDSIADEVQRIHKLDQRPIVVRSTPEKWQLYPEKSKELRNQFLEKMPGVRFLLMYHGLVTSGRGVENSIKVTSRFSDVGLVVLGNIANKNYKIELEKMVEAQNIKERVLFHDAVPFPELGSYISAVDVSTILSDIPGKSYYYGLPNKFFESIQSLVPIIATDLPEIKRIVNYYGIGLICPVGNIDAAVNCVDRLRKHPDLYQEMKENLLKAKNDLCWENEKKVLTDAFTRYLI